MSIKLMSVVWDMDMHTTKKFVLLALADCANDDGASCFPSVAWVAKKCNLSIRAVRNYIRELSTEGHISIDERTGRSSLYSIHPGTTCTPAPRARVNSVPTPPARRAAPPRQTVQGTPAPRAPISVIEPSVDPSPTRKSPTTTDRGSRIPEDFQLTEARRQTAKEVGVENPELTFRSFRNYWRSKTGKDATKKDWDATWENWCIKEKRDYQKKFHSYEAPARTAKAFPR